MRRSRTWPEQSLPDAGVADAHAAAEGQRRAGLLAGDEDRLRAVAARPRRRSSRKLDRAALAVLAVALADDRLEALHVQAVAVAVALPVLVSASSSSAGPETKASRSRQSGHSSSRSLGAHAARRRRSAARAGGSRRGARASSRSCVAEDDVVGRARGVQEDDVVERVAAVEVAQHAHDRRDAAAGADEEQLLGQRVGQHERALDAAEADDRARAAPRARGTARPCPRRRASA